jgi:hypothetical protein
MDLTPKNKEYIDSLSHEALLNLWRFHSVGDTWFQGETGTYWGERLAELRNAEGSNHVNISKRIGWEKQP